MHHGDGGGTATLQEPTGGGRMAKPCFRQSAETVAATRERCFVVQQSALGRELQSELTLTWVDAGALAQPHSNSELAYAELFHIRPRKEETERPTGRLRGPRFHGDTDTSTL